MRDMKVVADEIPFAPGFRFRVSGKMSLGLFPSLFTLQVWNLREQDYLRLFRTKELVVHCRNFCTAWGNVTDVYRQTTPDGTVTTAAFSRGLNLWEAQVSLTVEPGVSASETVRRLLAASGTGISLLSFPGRNPVFSRGQAFCGRAADCVNEVLSAASARGILVPAGLRVIPENPMPSPLYLTEKDLADAPSFAMGGKRMILSMTTADYPPGEELRLTYQGTTITGLILERLTEADTEAGPWSTQLLVEVRTQEQAAGRP